MLHRSNLIVPDHFSGRRRRHICADIVRRHGGRILSYDLSKFSGISIRFPVGIHIEHSNLHEFITVLGNDELLMSHFPSSPRLLETLYEVEHAGEEIDDAG
jgi:hypothetical protein